ncbi:MAG: MBL fold metallo-hydrolase [Clostridia bacterium]|nr:MBL fold metallo-hydrolase [Clostridia bacterium]
MKKFLKALVICLIILLPILVGCKSEPSLNILEVHFIDVGQADATLVLCGDKTMLIDGGNVDDSDLIYSYLKSHSVDFIDYMIATHPHEDHIGGLSGALRYADVGTVYSPVSEYYAEVFQIFAEQVGEKSVEITVAETGDTFSLGDADVEIIGVNSAEGENNSSIVLRITHGDVSFMFTADAERDTETVILDSGARLKSTVLKVGHHGSSDSTTYRFLKEVNPDYAVISVGDDNPYGHPHSETLSRLKDAGVTVYRTDEQGDIICKSNGKSVEFEFSEKKPTADININNCDYVINRRSKVFHKPDCEGVGAMSEHNREAFIGTREKLIADGYTACGGCKP